MPTNIDIVNKETYETSSVVKHYIKLNQLFPAEAAIFALLQDCLPGARLLDIGVGGGRTTTFFSKAVAHYTGIDYSQAMITACQKRSAEFQGKVSFEVGDVRRMPEYAADSFDLILFSYNGIDGMSAADRDLGLREIHRVCKPGGYFCFSSHNLQCLEGYLKLRFGDNPLRYHRKIIKYVLLRLFNRNYRRFLDMDYAYIRDGVHNFRISNFYIKPAYQIDQLEKLGFNNTRLFAHNGQEIKENLSDNQDNWIYYLCNVVK
jgi:ubiquinone/menaquinone biosynthesis C-methylase UbiE